MNERRAALQALYEADRGKTLDQVAYVLLATAGDPRDFWKAIPREGHELVLRYLEELNASSDREQAMRSLTREMEAAL
jgi:hypothetical protein